MSTGEMNLTRTCSVPKEGERRPVSETRHSQSCPSGFDFEEARHLKTPFRPDSFLPSNQTLTLSATLLLCWQRGMPARVRWERRSRKVSGNKEGFPVRTIPSFFEEPSGNLRAFWPRSWLFPHSKSLHFPPQKWAQLTLHPRTLSSLRRPYVRDVFFQFLHPLQGCVLGFCIFQKSPHIKHVV